LSGIFEVLTGELAWPGWTLCPGISATLKNILTGNLCPNIEQVILLYCHTILRKKLGYQFCFYSISEKKFYHAQCFVSNVTSNWKHTTSASLFAFCGGVVKDHEAPFSLNRVPLKNYLNLRSYVITCFFLSASVVESIFSCKFDPIKIFCKLKTWPKFSRFIYLNAIAFKNFKTSKTLAARNFNKRLNSCKTTFNLFLPVALGFPTDLCRHTNKMEWSTATI